MGEVAHRPMLRQMPDDFASSFVEHGHDRILEEIHRASWQTVMRWIRELPEDVLDAREEHLRKTRWPNGRPGPKRKARRYVMGQTLASKRREA